MPSLVSLAEELLANAKLLEGVMERNQIAQPSFENDTLESLPDEAQKLRLELLNTSHNFRQLIRGARLSGLDTAYGWTDQVILRIVWRYKLASTVPVDGSATYDDISAASGLGRSLVVRTTRAAMTMNIFDESSPGRVCHTAISRLLATDDGFYNSVGLQVEDLGPASLKLLEVWEKFGDDAGKPEESAFSLYNGGRSLFTVLAEEPKRARRFDAAMKYTAEDKAFDFSDVVQAFDWSSLDQPGSRVVDLGGGYGQISQALAKHTQHLTFTVQDLPHAAEQGKEKLPEELAGRVSFEARSFMDPQPSEDPPAAYLISRCLHNWSDQLCAVILRAIVPGLRKGSKVLIWDNVLDDRPEHRVSEKFKLQQDFIMATTCNGKDRSAEEFGQLLQLSDSRFAIDHIRRPAGCKLSMIIVSWKD